MSKVGRRVDTQGSPWESAQTHPVTHTDSTLRESYPHGAQPHDESDVRNSSLDHNILVIFPNPEILKSDFLKKIYFHKIITLLLK